MKYERQKIIHNQNLKKSHKNTAKPTEKNIQSFDQSNSNPPSGETNPQEMSEDRIYKGRIKVVGIDENDEKTDICHLTVCFHNTLESLGFAIRKSTNSRIEYKQISKN